MVGSTEEGRVSGDAGQKETASSGEPDDKRPRARKGYLIPAEARRAIHKAEEPSLRVFVAAGLADWLIVAAALGGVIVAYATLPNWAAVSLMVVAWAFVTVALRSVEALVHWGSHRNACKNDVVNDIVTDVLAAIPTGTTVRAFRESHDKHHRRYDTTDDPDKRRLTSIGADEIRRTSLLEYSNDLARRLPKYAMGWFQEIGGSRSACRRVIAFGLWHGGFVIVPLAALTAALSSDPTASFVGALAASSFWWLVTVGAPFLLFLPILRLMNEVAEHVYGNGDGTEFDSTVSNIGWLHRLVLHRHGDAFHGTHHLLPEVPFWSQKKVHCLLLRTDPIIYGTRLLVRLRVLQSPLRLGEVTRTHASRRTEEIQSYVRTTH